MPLNIGIDASGLDGKLRMVLDSLISSLQTWVGGQEGINAAQRLDELATGLGRLASVPTGAGFQWFTNTAPTGYLLCQGQAVSRATYAALYLLWGTFYGIGDGATTFNLPDLRQRFPLGKAASGTGATLGSTGGSIDHTHTGPSHTHTISASGTHTHSDGSYATDAHSALSNLTVDGNLDGVTLSASHTGHTHNITGSSGADGDHSHGGATAAGGTGATGTANPPFFVVNYIVKT